MENFKKVLGWHWLMVVVAALVMSAALTACGDDDDDNDGDEGGSGSLVGTWMYTEDEGYGMVGLCYSFNSDGSGFYVEGLLDEDYDFSDEDYFSYFSDYYVKDNKLYILWDGDDDYTYDGLLRNVTDRSFSIRWDGDDDDWMTFRRVY